MRQSDFNPLSKCLIISFMLCLLCIFCDKKNPAESDKNICKDIDGNVYKTVRIGNQVWMAENLKVTHYRNGDPIMHVSSDSVWCTRSFMGGAYCVYDHNDMNSDTYGNLYHRRAVDDYRHIAPEGWHVPTQDDWLTLIEFLGGDSLAGGKLKAEGTTCWESPNAGATNETGFTALPGGYRDCRKDDFKEMGQSAYFWVSEQNEDVPASLIVWCVSLSCNDPYLYIRFQPIELIWGYGVSVRCVKDD